MNLNIKDRVPTKPNRFLFTPEGVGEPFYAVMTRADEPTQEGTPINKELLDNMTKAGNISVSDEVAEQYGLDEYTKDVDHALQRIEKGSTYDIIFEKSFTLSTNTIATYDLEKDTAQYDKIIVLSSKPFTNAYYFNFNTTVDLNGYNSILSYGHNYVELSKCLNSSLTCGGYATYKDQNGKATISTFSIFPEQVFNDKKIITFRNTESKSIDIEFRILGVKYNAS